MSLVGQAFLFRRDEGVAQSLGVRRVAELFQHFGLLRDQTQPGQRVQMQTVILTTDQEKQICRLAIGRARGHAFAIHSHPAHGEVRVGSHSGGLGAADELRRGRRCSVVAAPRLLPPELCISGLKPDTTIHNYNSQQGHLVERSRSSQPVLRIRTAEGGRDDSGLKFQHPEAMVTP